VDWVYLAQNKDQLRGLVNTVMNLGVWEVSRQDALLLDSQDRLCSMKFIISIIIVIIIIFFIKLYLCN
jgi:hypothetical protein